jgi:guanyl-specific ribonuclease Sa
MNMKKTLAAVLAALASLLLLAVRHLDRDGTAPVTPRATATAGPAARVETTRRDTTPPDSHPAAQASRSLGDPALDAQVALVIDSMDRTGRPPDGVAQGGRKGGRRGTFQNAEGRLPTQPPGYYTESDVWPRAASGRGTHRLIFGRGGEVYYTADHYRTFVRVR